MARPARTPQPPTLFDLPLDPSLPEDLPQRPSRRAAAPPAELPAEMQEPLAFFEAEPPAAAREEAWVPREAPAAAALPASLAKRLQAAFADLSLHAAVGLVALFGAELLGARPDATDLPAVALFLAAFSLFYTVVPLAFWGATPGMAWAGIVCRGEGGLSLSFGQTFRHWLGSLLTLALAGLPLLLALGGRRSLADRLSGVHTVRDTAVG